MAEILSSPLCFPMLFNFSPLTMNFLGGNIKVILENNDKEGFYIKFSPSREKMRRVMNEV